MTRVKPLPSPPARSLAWLPAALALLLASFAWCARVQRSAPLWWSVVGVALALLSWWGVLMAWRRRAGRPLVTEVVPPVRQHYVQAVVQLLLYGYWGYWWVADGVRPIYDQAPLILAQLVFLYAFDGLWQWSRGRAWRLASGPVPIVLSTNLFIWFRDDWFVWQFVMITVGLWGKEFVRWTRDGRRTHVFNPSGFGLMCAASVLIATGTTDLTWAKPLAAELGVAHIFVVLFVLGLVVQFCFAVTLMTLSAALVMIACNLLYTELTGVYLFASSNLPAAAFLGLLLLMTDPSTSPRSNVGRAIFGCGYGLGYVVFFELLGAIGAPELYAKLYPVPLLNLTVRALDRFATRGRVGRLEHAWRHGLPARVGNWLHMAIWAGTFVTMLATGYVEAPHPGDSVAFWKRARHEGRHDAERKLVMVVGSRAKAPNVPAAERAAACNELGILSLTADTSADAASRARQAAQWFAEGAALGGDAATINLVQHFLANFVHRSDPELARALQRCQQLAMAGDGHAAYLIGVAVEYGAGVAPDAIGALGMYRRMGHADALAAEAAARIALRTGQGRVVAPFVAALERGVAVHRPASCYQLAFLCWRGLGVPADPARAASLLQSARSLGYQPALAVELESDARPPSYVLPRRKQIGYPEWATAFPLNG